jgi:hypothetical protein
MSIHRITFITPLFSKGCYDDRPEIRPPSIRGQLHWWFRALGGSYNDEKAIFGGVHDGAVASKVVVRASNINGQTGQIDTLPHKQGRKASPQWALKPGTSFDLHISERFGVLDARLRPMFQRSLETWLLLGTLGLRATRACGSFTWTQLSPDGLNIPASSDAYTSLCREVLRNSPLKFALLQETFASPDAARRVVSDTLGGRDDDQGENDLAELHYPLGKIFNGRKTSPLRFRIVKIDNGFRIAAVWDGRTAVTGNSSRDLSGVVSLLASKNHRIGQLMQHSPLR